MLRQGFFEKYFIQPFYRDFRNKATSCPKSTLPLATTAWVIITLGIVGVLIGFIGLLGPETGSICVYVGLGLWLLFTIPAFIALIRRCCNGNEDNSNPVDKYYDEVRRAMLPIDWMLSGAAVLFFILGPLMMLSTLRGRNMDILPRGAGDGYSQFVDNDSIYEEPIFNYIGESDASDADTLGDISDLDTITLEESSFDPTIEEQPDTISE